MITTCSGQECFEISPRFRDSIEARIARLEQDANHDEAHVAQLTDVDHIRRHLWLVAMQRVEAQRMRTFLERTRLRESRPLMTF